MKYKASLFVVHVLIKSLFSVRTNPSLITIYLHDITGRSSEIRADTIMPQIFTIACLRQRATEGLTDKVFDSSVGLQKINNE